MAVDSIEAIVLRTIRYAESDIIAHLFSLENGRCSVIAKGVRKPKTKLDGRLEPLSHVAVELYRGRGDLSVVRSVASIDNNFELRESYAVQEYAALGIAMLNRLTVEHEVNEGAFHLSSSFLRALARTTGNATVASQDELRNRSGALLCGYRLKLLHTVGIAPQLTICVRCGEDIAVRHAWSPRDGGTVCDECRIVADAEISESILDTTAWALATSLSAIAGAESIPGPQLVSAVEQKVVASICREHAGFQLKM